jgi:hypothetical protein
MASSPSHRFRIGQQVHVSLSPIHPGKSLVCEIMKLLPLVDGLPPEYQVSNSTETFERRVSESNLTALLTE